MDFSKEHQINIKGINIDDCTVVIGIKRASLLWKKGMFSCWVVKFIHFCRSAVVQVKTGTR